MTKDEALDLALAALKDAAYCVQNNYCPDNMGHDWDDTITAIKQARSAPVQEPVAYLFTNVQSGDIEASTNPDHKEGEREMWYREPLVRPPAAQRQWVGLTPTERKQIEKRYVFVEDAIRLTEAKLKEKNT